MDNANLQVEIKKLNGWTLVDDHHLFRAYKFPDFRTALAFVNHVGEVAEKMDHHPNISFTWGKVELSIWTHTENTVTTKDLELAKKIDQFGPK